MAQKAPKGLKEPRFLGAAPAPVNPSGGLKFTSPLPQRIEQIGKRRLFAGPERKLHPFQRLIERKRSFVRWLSLGTVYGEGRPGRTLSGESQGSRSAGAKGGRSAGQEQ